MVKALLALLLAFTVADVNAATYYRDRIVPGGVCMISFVGNDINASLIQEINIAPREWIAYEGLFSGYKQQPPYTSLRVTMVNRQYYEVKGTDLDTQKAALLKQIKEKCQ